MPTSPSLSEKVGTVYWTPWSEWWTKPGAGFLLHTAIWRASPTSSVLSWLSIAPQEALLRRRGALGSWVRGSLRCGRTATVALSVPGEPAACKKSTCALLVFSVSLQTPHAFVNARSYAGLGLPCKPSGEGWARAKPPAPSPRASPPSNVTPNSPRKAARSHPRKGLAQSQSWTSAPASCSERISGSQGAPLSHSAAEVRVSAGSGLLGGQPLHCAPSHKADELNQ